jgi:UDP-N-acetylmuramyl pentapeptide synthase
VINRLGARLAEICTEAFIVSSYYGRCASGAHRAGMARETLINADKEPLAAARALRDRLQTGDVVLVKGRNTQRLERVSLILTGNPVRCTLRRCRAVSRCAECPMLERGWDGVRARELLSF